MSLHALLVPITNTASRSVATSQCLMVKNVFALVMHLKLIIITLSVRATKVSMHPSTTHNVTPRALMESTSPWKDTSASNHVENIISPWMERSASHYVQLVIS